MNILQDFQNTCQRIADKNGVILLDIHKALITKAFIESMKPFEVVEVTKAYVKKDLSLAENFESDLIDELLKELIKKGAIKTETREDLTNFKTLTTAKIVAFCVYNEGVSEKII